MDSCLQYHHHHLSAAAVVVGMSVLYCNISIQMTTMMETTTMKTTTTTMTIGTMKPVEAMTTATALKLQPDLPMMMMIVPL